MSSFRSLLGRLGLALVSFLLTLLAIEVSLRLGWLAGEAYRSTAITERHSTRAANPDFRSPFRRPQARSQGFRILVVGDSFAWGDGVYSRDAFPHRLEYRLDDLAGRDSFDVVNWSRPGWNTVEQARSLTRDRTLRRLRPDLMILAYVLNDAEPVSLTAKRRVLGVQGPRREPSAVNVWLVEHSRLWSLVWTRWRNHRSHVNLIRYYQGLYAGEHWEDCQAALADLRRLSRKLRIPLAMVILPIFDGPLGDDYRYADLGIPVLDLVMAYQDVEARRLAVVPFSDAHPSELAHRIAADAILDWLVEQQLVPETRVPEAAESGRPAGALDREHVTQSLDDQEDPHPDQQ